MPTMVLAELQGRDFIDVPRLGFDKWVHYYKTEKNTPGQFDLKGYVGKKRLSI